MTSGPLRRPGRLAAALALCAAPAAALTPLQRDEAADLVARCLQAVAEGRPADTGGLRAAEGPAAEAVRAARGGDVWATPFGGLLLHRGGPRHCAMIAPGAEPRAFAWWVERWSNGPEGRPWVGKWFGRLETTAWRRFRRRGGSPLRVHAVTGGALGASEMRVMLGVGGR